MVVQISMMLCGASLSLLVSYCGAHKQHLVEEMTPPPKKWVIQPLARPVFGHFGHLGALRVGFTLGGRG